MYFNGNDWLGDCCILQEFLSQMVFYSGSERRALVKHSNKSGDIGSMLYGYTWRGPYLSPTKQRTSAPWKGLYQTKCVDEYPEFREVVKEFASLYFPYFTWCNIQLNKNFKIPAHIDSVNVGTSKIFALGDYTGGRLHIDFGEDGGIRDLNIQYQMAEFNGSHYRHWVDDFKGDRYSIVFFNNKQIANKMTDDNLL
jgi:hypothetical protein